MSKKRIGIVGATGYTGVELLRLLCLHPQVEIAAVTSRGEAGQRVDAIFPSLRQHLDIEFSDPADADLNACDLVFFATPNGVAMKGVPELVKHGVKVVDFSADFRLTDAALWSKWYGMDHACPQLLPQAVYGLPEVNREQVQSAQIVANPGCYPTATQLGFIPLLENQLINTQSLIADVKSGVSGAGRAAAVQTLFSEASDSIKAYGASGHRHHPEILQGLQRLSDDAVALTFVPHLTPMIRGIHATLYSQLRDKSVDVQSLYEKRYANEPFVDVMPFGSHPDTRSVRGSNVCRIALHRPNDADTLVVLAVEDNLVKGAAGQAVQNMNLMLGFDETTALNQPALMP